MDLVRSWLDQWLLVSLGSGFFWRRKIIRVNVMESSQRVSVINPVKQSKVCCRVLCMAAVSLGLDHPVVHKSSTTVK